MDQDRLAGRGGAHVQHLRGSRGSQQEIGGLLEGESARFGEHVACRDIHVTGPAAEHPEAEHLITDGAAARGDLGVGTDGREHTGDLVPDAPWERCSSALGDVRGIGWVHPCRAHLDGDLTGRWRRHVVRHEVEDFQASRPCSDPVLRHGRANDRQRPSIPPQAPFGADAASSVCLSVVH
jgi:hypothetical protein